MTQINDLSSWRDRPAPANEPIAVIGLSCRFPGADNAKAFWRLLRDGGDAITEIPAERWNVDDLYDPNLASPGKMNTRYGGFIENIAEFDPLFFGVSPREAATMDPQQRLMLEVSWEALEDAGLAPDRVRGAKTGVFVGVFNNDYLAVRSGDLNCISAYFSTGSTLSMVANRVSHFLDLRGPSLAVDTGCSSSLVAVHLACKSLLIGECDMAVVGGVNVILSPHASIALSQAWMMAADGRCKSFDASADGFVRGEGCGVVILKRLADAQRDGNRILAVIRGSAVNQGGRGAGLTAPSRAAQEAVIRQALDDAGVSPNLIDYVEAHGIGMPLADAIEMQSLAAVFGAARSDNQPCLIGSVKPNIGHLETASGISSLIKMALCLQHAEIPPLLHLKNIHPDLGLEGLPMRIATQLTAWPASSHPKLAGIHSFGLGGTNAHLIVEQAPDSSADMPIAESPVHLLTLSARSEPALKELARRYHDHLTEDRNPSLTDICYTANTGRARFSHRLAIKADSISSLRQRLIDCAEDDASARVFRRVVGGEGRPKIAFIFGELFSPHSRACRDLYDRHPDFRRAIDECDRALGAKHTRPPGRLLGGEPDAEGFALIDQTKPGGAALFACEYALAQMWIAAGVVPDAVFGEGPGEYVAACLAGVITLEDGLKLAADRERLSDPSANSILYGEPHLLMVSGVTGDVFTPGTLPDAGYWRRQINDVATFRKGLKTLVDTGHKIFLGVGEPLGESRAIASGICDGEWISTFEGECINGDAVIDAAAKLYLAGADLKWAGIDRRSEAQLVSLPAYPFQRRRCWLDPPQVHANQAAAIRNETTGEAKVFPVPRAAQRNNEPIAARNAWDGETPTDLSGPCRQLRRRFPGSMKGLTIEPAERQTPGPGEVEIRVHAAGLNYRDLMIAMDVYPGDQVAFGGECAGTIARIGPDVVGFAVGDGVIAFSSGAFADYVRTSADFVWMKPAALSFAESATLPIAFLTAHYAINHLARIAKGERILIHAAAGGVGLAALQLAQQAGAEVLATAGNDEKRAFLRALGVKHTFNSRSLDFAEDVMQCTEGRGVDVVLNSLAGEFIPKSLSVLAPCGRFLEIGKRDFFENTPLGMRVFEKNVAFFGIDLNIVLNERPAMIRSMLFELMESFNRGDLKPLPLRAFPIQEAVAAFSYMAKAKHIGKVVLCLRDDATESPQAVTKPSAPGQSPDPVPLREAIMAAGADQRLQLLKSYVCEQLSKALGLSPIELDVQAPLSSLGLDSLMALELKNRFETQLDVTLPLSIFLGGPSIVQVTRTLNDLFDDGGCRPSQSFTSSVNPDGGAQRLLAEFDNFSDAEVDLLLNRMLKEGASVNG